MKWKNVKLVLGREVRDQLRDRRTMFMIFVLPVLLYPFLGMSFFQVAQFVRENPSKIVLIGADRLPFNPPLFAEVTPADESKPPAGADAETLSPSANDKPDEDGEAPAAAEKTIEPKHFNLSLFRSSAEQAKKTQQLLEVYVVPSLEDLPNAAKELSEAERLVSEGKYEVAVVMPRDFGERLAELRIHLENRESGPTPTIPQPVIYHHGAKEKSDLAFARVFEVLRRWGEEIGRENLETVGVDESAVRPFEPTVKDIAEAGRKAAAVWSRLFPFMLLIWSLTGAFYPAVDLCAGEKERGTLETLLSSPAERTEIVWGKLLTIMTFSVVTVMLNLLSIVITGFLVMSQIEGIGPPPVTAFLWLLAAIFPVSALFSAVCLGLAAFARSTKEGQYYLMPVFMVTLPLVLAPMSPGTELSLGNSLIPITGIVLLLRTLIEGELLTALPYVPIVVGVTGVCCVLAIRWAVDQFNSESVLFRESERFSVGLWIKHLRRDRGETPSAAEALFCGVLILLVGFVMNLSMARAQAPKPATPPGIVDQLPGADKFQVPDPAPAAPTTADSLLKMTMISQLVVVLTPALLMTIMLTRSPLRTLSLYLPPLAAVPGAILLAIFLHPFVNDLRRLVLHLYPLPTEITEQLEGLFSGVPVGLILFCVGFVAPICEELAFRGFILSGLRHLGHRWRAIVISSLFFAFTHQILQQSLLAFLQGLLLGYLVVQSRSLLPAIAYHMTNNTLPFVMDPLMKSQYFPAWMVRHMENKDFAYHPAVVGIGLVGAVLIFWWFHQLPYARSKEEALQEAIDEANRQPVAG